MSGGMCEHLKRGLGDCMAARSASMSGSMAAGNGNCIMAAMPQQYSGTK